ncbi:MAG TPA: glycosyltransferase family 4 protein, partial [Acidimicrobiales bacterium]|nr:glycosyltransferase family 4 protein [Acidimicrobiales bacterium]
ADPGVRSLGPTVPLSSNGSIARIAPGLASVRRTMAALRDGAYDVVHVHEPLVPGPAMASLLYDHGPMIGTFHRSGASHAYAAFDPLVRRWARRLSVRCAVSPEARATAEAALGGTYELVFNAVETAPYVDAAPQPTAGPTVFFIGRHEERKGLAVLLEAWTRLGSEVRCWVGGTGPDTAALQARFSGYPGLQWLGRIGDDEKVSRLKGADVVCVPSLYGESFGVVLLEAMAAGTPVVASDLPGYRNVASDEVDALLVAPGDADALARALRCALDDRDLAAKLVEAGRQRAEELSMDRLAALYVGYYGEAREDRHRAMAAR